MPYRIDWLLRAGVGLMALTAGAQAQAQAAPAAGPAPAPAPAVDRLVGPATPPPSLHRALGLPDALTLTGSVRVRYEAIDGQARPGFESASDLVSLRSTLFADYDFGPVRLGGEVRDARVYAASPGTPVSTSEVNALEPVQAYVIGKLGDALGRGSTTTVQAGRMTIILGAQRFITSEEFRNTANGYTGVRADVRTARGSALTLLWTMPQTRLPSDRVALGVNRTELDRESPDLTLWGGLLTTRPLLARGRFDAGYYRLAENDGANGATPDRHLHTINLRYFRDAARGKLDWEFDGAYQFGRISASTAPLAARRSVDAGFYHLRVGYTWPAAWSPRLSVEYDYASGARSTGAYGRFDTLFGGRRADFSPSGLYNVLNRTNISSPGIRMEVAPSRRMDAMAAVRGLFLAEPTDSFSTSGVRDATGRSGTYAGVQIDARLRYWVRPQWLRLEINADYLAKGRFLTDAPNAPRNGDTLYGAMSLLVTF